MTFQRQAKNLPHSQTSRRGLTLVEMLLVLAVLGVMAAMTWPGIQRVWADHKLQEATEMVRSNLAKTRNIAVDAVLIYEFRYEPGGNRFIVVPHESNGFIDETDATNPQGQVSNTGAQLVRIAGVLREDVEFTVVVDETASLGIPEVKQTFPVADWQLQGLPMAEELKDVAWSEPMLFYPDGSADESRFRLIDEYGQRMDIAVRGLTGAVTATPVKEEVGL